MPTVRLRDASEYAESIQKLFEVAKAWLKLEIPVHGAAENGCWKAVAVIKQACCRDAG